MTDSAIGIKTTRLRIGAGVVTFTRLVRLMLMFVMTDVMGRYFGFMLAISRDGAPGKLERHYKQ